jgi:AhpD family alkylhydroperoxidase
MIEQPRMNLAEMTPDAFRHLLAIDGLISKNLDHTLSHLVKIRASQINGCAFCLAMHTDAALKEGERPERLFALPAWRESPLFEKRERSALAWLEEITLIADHGASAETYEDLGHNFSQEEIGWLTMLSALINCANRLAIASRLQYDPGLVEAAKQLAHQD